MESRRRVGGRGAEDRKWTRSDNPPQVPSLASSPRAQAGRDRAEHAGMPTLDQLHIPLNGPTAQKPADGGGGGDQMGGADSPPAALRISERKHLARLRGITSN